METLFLNELLIYLPCLGLLLLLLIPSGDLLRKHLLYLIARYGDEDKSAQKEGATGKVANDLIRWGILKTNGDFDRIGIAFVIILIEAKSPRDIASTLPPNAAGAFCFYEEIIANAPTGDSNENDDLGRLAMLLRQFLQQEQDDPVSSASPSINYSTNAASSSGPLVHLAMAVHSLGGRLCNDGERSGSYLRLRKTVSLFPQSKPQQARIIWKIAGRENHLSIITSLNASFGIYLGSRTCRVSLFSSDIRKQELINYGIHLEKSLADVPNPEGSVRYILYPTLTGRRTLTASWSISIDQKTTPEYILNFANEVWTKLSYAMEQTEALALSAVTNYPLNNNTNKMNYKVIRVVNNCIMHRYGNYAGATPGEAIAEATVSLNIPPGELNQPNRAWLVRSIYLVPQIMFTSIKTSEDARFNEGGISSGAGFYYVNCRKFVGRSSVETSLYQRMRVYPDVTWHKEPQGLMGQGGGVGYAGYAKFNTMADAQAYLQDMAFIVTDLSN